MDWLVTPMVIVEEFQKAQIQDHMTYGRFIQYNFIFLSCCLLDTCISDSEVPGKNTTRHFYP